MENQSKPPAAPLAPASNVVSITDAQKRSGVEPPPAATKPGNVAFASEQIKAAIEKRLGYFPPPLTPALDSPAVIESLWNQMRSGYLENPLSAPFKEKLQARLARYCSVPYAIVSHSTRLKDMGLSSHEVLELLNLPAPTGEADLEQYLQMFEAEPGPLKIWPKHNSLPEKGLIHCSLFFFVKPGRSPRVQSVVSRFIGPEFYANLMAFLAYVKSYHLLVESNPGPPIESVPRVWDKFIIMLREEPRLAKVFRDYRLNFIDRKTGERADKSQVPTAELESRLKKTSGELTKAIEILKEEIPRRKQVERELMASQERFTELFETTGDLVISFDLTGNIVSLNSAAAKFTGYSREEALQMNIAQLLAPEYTEAALKMLDAGACAGAPITYPLGILTKDNVKETLEVHQRLISRHRKSVEFQIIARRAEDLTPPAGIEEVENHRQALATLESGLKAKLAELTEANKVLQSQLEEQKNVEAALRTTLVETSSRSVELFKAYTSLQVRIARSEGEKDTLQGALTESEVRLADAVKTHEGLQEKLAANQDELRSAQAASSMEGTRLQTEIQELSKAKDELKARLEERAREADSLRKSLADSQGRLSDALAAREEAKVKISSLEVRLETLQKSIADSEARLAATVASHRVVLSQAAGPGTEQEALLQTLAEIQGRLEESHKLQEALKAQISSLHEEKEKLQREAAEQETRLGDALRAGEELTAQIAERAAENESLRADLEKSAARLAQAVEDGEALQAQIAGHVAEKEELRKALWESENRLAEVFKGQEFLQQQLAAESREKEILKGTVSERDAQLARIAEVHEALHEKAKRLGGEKEELQKSLAQSEARLVEALGTCDELLKETAKSEERIRSLQEAAAAAETGLREQIAGLAKANDELRAGIGTRETAAEELRKAQAETAARLDDALRAREELQKEIARSEEEKRSLQEAASAAEANLREQIAGLAKANDELRANFGEQEAAVGALRKSLHEAGTALAESAAAKAALQAQLAGQENTIEGLRKAAVDAAVRFLDQTDELARANEGLRVQLNQKAFAEENLRKTLAETEAREAGIRESHDSLQRRAAGLEEKVESLGKTVAASETRIREQEAELLKAVEALGAETSNHESERNALNKALSESEALAAELQKNNDALLARIARGEAAEASLRESVEKCQVWKRELDEYRRQLSFLSEMGSMLRVCMNAEEAVAVISQEIEQIFPHHSGTLYLMKPGQNAVESVFQWGASRSSKPTFATEECYALQRCCIHTVKKPRAGLICRHIQTPISSGYACVPMIAHREVLGVLHLEECESGSLSETGQRLAATVTEYVAMALSNLIGS